jgi:hypothetical protein
LWKKLQADPAQKAFVDAMGTRYTLSATGPALITRLEKDVAAELAQILRFDTKLNAMLIEQRWKGSLSDPPV